MKRYSMETPTYIYEAVMKMIPVADWEELKHISATLLKEYDRYLSVRYTRMLVAVTTRLNELRSPNK